MLKNAARNGPMIGWDLMRESNLESGSYVLFMGQLTAFFRMELSRIFPFVISQVLYFRSRGERSIVFRAIFRTSRTKMQPDGLFLW